MTRRNPDLRFWEKALLGDGCWEWQAARDRKGYGRYAPIKGKAVFAHRFAWEWMNGPIPIGLHICHHCDNPRCVRPDHLFAGTAGDNVRDAKTKGRMIPPPPSTPKERCRRGHLFSEHGVVWKQGRVCGACEELRRRRPCHSETA